MVALANDMEYDLTHIAQDHNVYCVTSKVSGLLYRSHRTSNDCDAMSQTIQLREMDQRGINQVLKQEAIAERSRRKSEHKQLMLDDTQRFLSLCSQTIQRSQVRELIGRRRRDD